MNALILILKQFLGKIIMLFFSFLFVFYSVGTGVSRPMEKAGEDFKPVLRFSLCSDVHLDGENKKNEEKFKELFDVSYKYARKESYKKLDALVVCGDMTGSGKDSEYEIFTRIIEKKMKKETTLLSCLGNHEFIEYRDYDASIGYDKYKKHVNEEVDTHEVVNGYHFIGISYSEDGRTFDSKAAWLKEQLDIAVKDTGEKPIFVFQHPHPTLTVYGSVNCSDADIRKVLQNYPQVIDFSGHSHYAANDPRSVWQGAFTAVGTGAVEGSMGNLNYINGDAYGKSESGTFYIVEADKDGNVRLKLYDLCSNMFFEDREIYFSEENYRKYSWSNQRSLDTKPQFPVGTKIEVSENKKGETVLSFNSAKGYYPAESYRITVVNKKYKPLFAETVLSVYTRADYEKEEINIGELPNGEYKAYITSYSPYSKTGGRLKTEFSVK